MDSPSGDQNENHDVVPEQAHQEEQGQGKIFNNSYNYE